MALYFDRLLPPSTKGALAVDVEWHPIQGFIAVAAYSEEKGGIVVVYNEPGDILDTIEAPPSTASAQSSALSWHPTRPLLAIGWEGGEVWCVPVSETVSKFGGKSATKDYMKQSGAGAEKLHKDPVGLLQWSRLGSRMVSGDQGGCLVGWRVDERGVLSTTFHHDLKDPLTQLVFRSIPEVMPPIEFGSLSGVLGEQSNEMLLDRFTTPWRPRTSKRKRKFSYEDKEHIGCFVGTSSGHIYYINETGGCVEVLVGDGGILRLLYHSARDLLVAVIEGMILGQFLVDPDGAVTEVSKVKLSTRSPDAVISWAGPGLLAVSGGEASVRLWDLDAGDNYVLSLEDAANNETITSLAFSPSKNVLAVGTNVGRIGFWKYNPPSLLPISDKRRGSLHFRRPSGLLSRAQEEQPDPEANWELLPSAKLTVGGVKQLTWGSSKSLLAANCVKQVCVLQEQVLSAHYKDHLTVVQVSPSLVLAVPSETSVSPFPSSLSMSPPSWPLKTTAAHISGLHTVTSDKLIVWSTLTHKASVFELESEFNSVTLMGSFSVDCEAIVAHDQSLYLIEGNKVQVRTFQGTMKQTLNFLESEGDPISLDVSGTFLVVATLLGVVKIWDLSRREARPHASPKILTDHISDFGEIISAKANCKGTRVSICIANSSLLPDPKLYVWDISSDSLAYFNFLSGHAEDDDHAPPPNSADSEHSKEFTALERSKHESSKEVGGRFVLNHFWDPEEPRLLTVEAKKLPRSHDPNSSLGYNGMSAWDEKADVLIVTLFAMPEGGLIVEDTFALSSDQSSLVGLQVPFMYILKKPKASGEMTGMIEQRIMKEFAGLESADESTRTAMMDFSFFLAVGNMDEAFKAIKTIKSGAVWENLARMCVKTKRLDVAAVCLGNMGHARGAKALREAVASYPELDARVAVLAVQLGMNEEAERLLHSAGRVDLLNKFLQDKGEWDRALTLAEDNDRIHLRDAHYKYAKFLEANGEYTEAIRRYENAGAHHFEVPRMLFDDPIALENYVRIKGDRELKQWWAQYMESTGEMEAALQYYESAKDALSLVRVHCYCGNLATAADIANSSSDKAACYHLARQYENTDMVKDAIHFYTRAHAYGNAIRLCKENEMTEQMCNLALMAGKREQLEAARFCEQQERAPIDKAILLYHKAGLLSKAIELAFRHRKFHSLQTVALDLTAEDDPQLIQTVADYFIENDQFDKAVDLLAIGKRYVEALDLCVNKNIQITEDFAERMTISKEDDPSGKQREEVLRKIGECAFSQGNYQLAAKKYTQAGDRVGAMKALLKSGDTEKIIFFANVSRQKEIYVMAANYLQSLDWRKNPETMKNIITFYSKGRSPELLAGFYIACAQVEIDEYQNYEKGLEALMEAYKAMAKSEGPQTEDRLLQIKARAERIQHFVRIKMASENDPSNAIAKARELLMEANIDVAVRKGDIYGFIVETMVRQKNFKGALNVVDEMRSTLTTNVNLEFYINPESLDAISQALGVVIPRGRTGNVRMAGLDTAEEDTAEIEEEVDDQDEGAPTKGLAMSMWT